MLKLVRDIDPVAIGSGVVARDSTAIGGEGFMNDKCRQMAIERHMPPDIYSDWTPAPSIVRQPLRLRSNDK